MKKYAALCFGFGLLALLLSFSVKPGGDVFEIYFNGKQVLQQFVHVSKGTKTLQLASLNENDKIDVVYSHCGRSGSNRTLVIKNAKEEVIKELKFADGSSNRSVMSFYRKDIPVNKNSETKLYYYSKELPEGRLLANVQWSENKVLAKL